MRILTYTTTRACGRSLAHIKIRICSRSSRRRTILQLLLAYALAARLPQLGNILGGSATPRVLMCVHPKGLEVRDRLELQKGGMERALEVRTPAPMRRSLSADQPAVASVDCPLPIRLLEAYPDRGVTAL